MSVSTKATGGRASGVSGPPAGPIAAPRVIGNRRVRAGGIALAVMLLALGAALSGIALVSASRTASYLAMANDVPVGAQIQPTDLRSVELSGGAGLEAIPASQINYIVGKYAKVPMVKGTLAVVNEFTAKPNYIRAGEQVFPVPVIFSRLPPVLTPGDRISMIPLGSTGGTVQFTATIISVLRTGTDNGVILYLAAPPDQAIQIIQINNNPGFIFATAPKGD